MPKPIHVGFLGTGGIAKAHAKDVISFEGVEITAVCDISKENAGIFTADFAPEARIYQDFGRMIGDETLDALITAIPPGAHNGEVERAAESGIHLFLEKPIALTTERAYSQVKAVKSAGVIAMVGYMNRFGAAIRKMKTMIDDGTAGPATLMQGRYFCNNLHAPWWRNKEMSGSQIMEQIIHTFDLTLYLFGEPESVSAYTANICHQEVEGYTVEDTSASIIRFKNGAMATVAGSNCAIPGKWINDFRVVCGKVTAEFTDSGHGEFTFTGDEPVHETVSDNTPVLREELKVFFDCVRGGYQTEIPIEEGFRGVALTNALTKSADAGGIPVVPRALKL